jgi:hypothetical protein
VTLASLEFCPAETIWRTLWVVWILDRTEHDIWGIRKMAETGRARPGIYFRGDDAASIALAA